MKDFCILAIMPDSVLKIRRIKEHKQFSVSLRDRSLRLKIIVVWGMQGLTGLKEGVHGRLISPVLKDI